jgi:hypothetical protein
MARVTSAAVDGCLLSFFLVLLYGAAALAQQSKISGNYPPFSVTLLKATIAPPPGTVALEIGSIFYNNRHFVDSHGDTIRKSDSAILSWGIFQNRRRLNIK